MTAGGAEAADSEVVLYQFAFSPFCDKIRRILAVKGVVYETRNITLFDSLRGKIKKLSGQTKVPFLTIGGDLFADSTEIAYELERRWPRPSLLPEDESERSLVHFFEDWADESLYFLEAHLRFGLEENARRFAPVAFTGEPSFMRPFAVPLMRRAITSMTVAQGTGRKSQADLIHSLERHLTSLEQHLSGRTWLVGEQCSLADVAVYSQLQCIALAPQGEEALRTRERTVSWLVEVAKATGGYGDPFYDWQGPA